MLATHKKLAKLVNTYKAFEQPTTTSPSAPDTSKFVITRSGKLNVELGYQLRKADYYGFDRQFVIAISAGGNYPCNKFNELMELAKPLLQALSDNFDAETYIMEDNARNVYGIVCDTHIYNNAYTAQLKDIYK